MSRSNRLRSACALTWTLPNAQTCSTSISLTLASGSRRLVTVSRPPSMPTIEPGSVTYSGTASGSAAISRRGWLSFRLASMLVSSGRQMPTSEQRGHFGLDSSGGGGASRAAVDRASATIDSVLATSSGSGSTVTRCRVCA